MSMTRDEALETIAVMLQHTQTDCDYAYDNTDGSEDLLPGQDLADALRLALAALREQEERRWIPVTERLHSDGHVLVTDGDQVKISCRNACYKTASGEFRCAQGYGSGMPVTHWMPLPEPPKEGV